MQSILVELKERSYPILVSDDLLVVSESWLKFIKNQQVMIVTNNVVAPLYLEKILASLKDFQCDYIVLPDGEKYKSLETLNLIFDELMLKQHRRTTTLISLGGGVIGDLTGFAAACYMRGVDYLHIPTTLLAQVDSAIGGKTAVNHRLGKNIIGAFHQPKAVVIDTTVLQTLPEREFKAGLAEVLKYGIIHDAAFFEWLKSNIELVLKKDAAILQQIILISAKIKARYVMEDEFEHGENGIRVNLNFGHTFAHAIEQSLGYGTWLHGEAVGLGMLIAADLSERIGFIKREEVAGLKNILLKIGLPTQLPKEITPQDVIESMRGDKKNISKKIRLVLLKAIGESFATEDVDNLKIQETLFSYTYL